jgi:peptidyl-prolyl cis-trans isomerase D
MTMMISKFNKMIQNKLIWGVILVVIVMSFVVWGMVWPDNSDEAQIANAAGKLNGELISHAAYRSAYLSTYLARALAVGRDVQSTPETDRILRDLSWQRLATLQEAAKLGVVATDQELIRAIQGNFVNDSGAYDPQRYQAFLQGIIAPLGFNTAQFEQHIREEIISQKMGSLIGRQATVTPLEIERTFETLMDTFTVEYATVSMEEVDKSVKTTKKDAKAAYEADPALFTIPEQRKVKYAAFTIADFADESEEITEDDILDYYDLNIEDYTTETENEDGTVREEVAEVDTVRDDIVTALRLEATMERVEDAAEALSNSAIPDRDGIIPDFDAQVKTVDLTVESLEPFSLYDLPLEDGGRAFVASTFERENNPIDRVSYPVFGEERVYVIYLEDILEPRIPEFDEARKQAKEMAHQQALVEAMKTKADDVKKAAEKGLAKGKTFAEAVKGEDVSVDTEEDFTGLSGSSSSNLAVQALVQTVVGYNRGEVADPVLVGDDLLVAYIQSRTPADPASFDAYSAEIANAIRSRRAQGLFRDWQAGLLTSEHFEDLQRPIVDPDDEEEYDIEAEDVVVEEES